MAPVGPGSLVRRGIVRASGVAGGTAGHHAGMLERSGRAWTEQVGFRRLHFPGPRPDTKRDVEACLVAVLDDFDHALLAYVRSRSRTSQRDALEAFPARLRATVQHRLARLVRRGFLGSTLSGRRVHYHTTTDVPLLAVAANEAVEAVA